MNTPQKLISKEEALEVCRKSRAYDLVLTGTFLGLMVVAIILIPDLNLRIQQLTTFNVIVLVLAAFRLVQLFTTDNVFQWLRDIVFDAQVEEYDPQIVIKRTIPVKGMRRELAILVDCPWCISMWIAFGSIVIWTMVPQLHIMFYILALSGVAASLHVLLKKATH